MGSCVSYIWAVLQSSKASIAQQNITQRFRGRLTPPLNFVLGGYKMSLKIWQKYFGSLIILVSVWLGFAAAAYAENPPSFVMKWGTPGNGEGSGDGQFGYPMGLAVDNQNNIYVADNHNYRIQKFDSNGNFLFKWGSMGTTGNGQFYAAMRIATDSTGNSVYVSDCYNSRVQKFDRNGNFLLKWGGSGTADGQFTESQGIAVDGSGNVYVADFGNSRIEKFDSSGNFLLKWGSYGSGNGQFASAGGIPLGLAINRSSGNIYVADTKNHRIQKFDSNGNFLLKWGNQGAGDGQFSTPNGVCVDNTGNVYVADRWNHRIQKFDSNGNFLSRWGSQGTGDVQFDAPSDVAIDSFGDIYVTEGVNNRIQKFTYTPRRVIGLTGSLAFGNVQIGAVKQLTFTIGSTGNMPLNVSSITYPAGFTGDWNSGTIAAGASQTVTATFAPAAGQTYSGTVTVNSDKTAGTETLAISGTGISRIISLSGSLAFGDVIVSKTKQLTLTVSNTGNSTLTVSSIAYPAGFSGNWSGGIIAAGGSQSVTVTFSPTAVQSYSGTVTVNSDKTGGTDTLAISGNGITDPCNYTDTNGSTQQGIDLVNANPGSYQLLTQAQSDQAVKNEQLKWDANGDGKIGLEDIIRMLQVIAGLRP